MQIKMFGLPVQDQETALRFYTEVIGFTKKEDIPMGEFRWLTVTSPEGLPDVEMVLEPTAFPPSKTYQEALFEAGIPATAFITDDIAAEHARLVAAGVVFRMDPTEMGPIITATFEDTCGNIINLVQTV